MNEPLEITQRELGQMMGMVKALVSVGKLDDKVAELVQESLASTYELKPILVV